MSDLSRRTFIVGAAAAAATAIRVPELLHGGEKHSAASAPAPLRDGAALPCQEGIDTGVLRCKVNRTGAALIESIERDGRPILSNGRLIVECEDRSFAVSAEALRQVKFTGDVEKATIEQSGPLRAVIKLEGRHLAL